MTDFEPPPSLQMEDCYPPNLPNAVSNVSPETPLENSSSVFFFTSIFPLAVHFQVRSLGWRRPGTGIWVHCDKANGSFRQRSTSRRYVGALVQNRFPLLYHVPNVSRTIWLRDLGGPSLVTVYFSQVRLLHVKENKESANLPFLHRAHSPPRVPPPWYSLWSAKDAENVVPLQLGVSFEFRDSWLSERSIHRANLTLRLRPFPLSYPPKRRGAEPSHCVVAPQSFLLPMTFTRPDRYLGVHTDTALHPKGSPLSVHSFPLPTPNSMSRTDRFPLASAGFLLVESGVSYFALVFSLVSTPPPAR